MNKIITQRIAILSVVLSHLSMAVSFLDSPSPIPFYLTWAVGVVGYVSNVILSDNLRMSKAFTLATIVSGLSWILFPIALMTIIGWPILAIYFIFCVIIHFNFYTKIN